MSKLSGVITAMPTPLLDNEDVDVQALQKLIDYVIDGGASGVFVLGNMGEGPALLDSQKLLVIKTAVEHTNSRVPVLAGILDVSPRRTIELGRKAKELKPDYLVITTPFYYRFPQTDSLVGSVEKIANELDCPIVFYHCPGATGNKVSTEGIERIMHVPQIKALKDSSGDIHLFSKLLRMYPDKDNRPCAIFQGDEFVYDISLLLGADGVITGGGTVFVENLVKLYNAAAVEKDQLKAFKLQLKFRKEMDDMLGPDLLTDWMYAIKTKLKEKGVINNNVVFPFIKRKK